MRKLVLLAATLAIVLLVVAPALSQTGDSSNTDEGGIVDNILDLLGSDEGDDGEDEARDLNVGEEDADTDADAGENEEGDTADEGDDAVDTDFGEGGGDEGDDGTDTDLGEEDGASDGDDIVVDVGEDEEGEATDEDEEGDDTTDTDVGGGEDEGAEEEEEDDAEDTDIGEGRDDGRNSADEADGVDADDVGANRDRDREGGGRDGDRDGRDNRNDGDSGDGSKSISSFEQDTDSGDITQTFSITGPGDNASQCLNISPVANSGNAQNHIGVQPGGGDVDDRRGDRGKNRDRNNGGNVEFNDVNATLDVSGGSTVTCDQQVNQAATASGG